MNNTIYVDFHKKKKIDNIMGVHRIENEIWTNFFERILDKNEINLNAKLIEDNSGYYHKHLTLNPDFSIHIYRSMNVGHPHVLPSLKELVAYDDINMIIGAEYIDDYRDQISLEFLSFGDSQIDFHFNRREVVTFQKSPGCKIAGLQNDRFEMTESRQYKASLGMYMIVDFIKSINELKWSKY